MKRKRNPTTRNQLESMEEVEGRQQIIEKRRKRIRNKEEEDIQKYEEEEEKQSYKKRRRNEREEKNNMEDEEKQPPTTEAMRKEMEEDAKNKKKEGKRWSQADMLSPTVIATVLTYIESPLRIIELGRVNKKWYYATRDPRIWETLNIEAMSKAKRINTLEDVCKVLRGVFPRENTMMIRNIQIPATITYQPETLKQMAKMTGRYLETLVLPVSNMNRESIKEETLYEVTAECRKLKSLTIATHNALGGKTMNMITQHCPQLEQLNANYIPLFQQEEGITFPTKLKKLSLLYAEATPLHTAHLEAIGRDCKQLTHLACKITHNAQIESIQNLLTLKSLHLTNITSFNIIEQLRNYLPESGLKHLTIESNQTIHMNSLRLPEGLKTLTLADFASIESINMPKSLKSMRLSNIQNMRGHFIGGKGIESLIVRHMRLRALPESEKMESMELTLVTGMETLNLKLAQLSFLSIYMCSDIKTLAIDASKLNSLSVDVCPSLLKLKVNSDALRHVDLFSLSGDQAPLMNYFEMRAPALKKLSLRRAVHAETVILDCDALESLNMANCKQLQNFDCKAPQLTRLALAAPQLPFQQDMIIQQAAKTPNLTMMSLSRIPLREHDVQRITQSFKKLQALIITHCDTLVNPFLQSNMLTGIRFSACRRLQSIEFDTPNLVKASFIDCPLLNQVPAVLPPQLASLTFERCIGLQSPWFASGLSLATLSFIGCPSLTYPKIEPALACLSMVRFVNCSRLCGNPFTAPMMHRVECLVEFHDCQMNTEHIADIFKRCPFMTLLGFKNVTGFPFAAIPPHALCRGVSFSQCDHLQCIQVLPGAQLKQLKVEHCNALAQIQSTVQLTRIEAMNCKALVSMQNVFAKDWVLANNPELVHIHPNVPMHRLTCTECPKLLFIEPLFYTVQQAIL